MKPFFIEHQVIVRGRDAERWEHPVSGERHYFISRDDGGHKLISVAFTATKLRAEIDAAIAKAKATRVDWPEGRQKLPCLKGSTENY